MFPAQTRGCRGDALDPIVKGEEKTFKIKLWLEVATKDLDDRGKVGKQLLSNSAAARLCMDSIGSRSWSKFYIQWHDDLTGLSFAQLLLFVFRSRSRSIYFNFFDN